MDDLVVTSCFGNARWLVSTYRIAHYPCSWVSTTGNDLAIWQYGNDLARTWQRLGMLVRDGACATRAQGDNVIAKVIRAPRT